MGRLGGILCLTVLATASCSGSANDVTVATAVSGTIAADTGGLGTTEAAIDVPIALSFTDHVQDVIVGFGQQVKKGQPLLSIDPQPLLANVSHLQARLLRAQANQARIDAELAAGKIPQALVPSMQDHAQTMVSQINLYDQLLAEARGQQSTVTSPVAGEVLAVNVQAHQVAKPGATLIEIVDYHRIVVTAELPVSSQPYIKPGDRAQITFAALPGLSLTGVVSGVSPGSVNYGSGFQLTIEAANTPDERVHPGYQAYVRVSYPHGSAGVIVRRMAVLNINAAPSMFVINGDVAQLRQVRVGAESGPDVEIVAGIAPGDEYVLAGNENLATGDRVSVTSDLGPLRGNSG